ncbi:MAG: hypothetical protein QXO76_00140 [Thermoproteota archaeon]
MTAISRQKLLKETMDELNTDTIERVPLDDDFRTGPRFFNDVEPAIYRIPEVDRETKPPIWSDPNTDTIERVPIEHDQINYQNQHTFITRSR